MASILSPFSNLILRFSSSGKSKCVLPIIQLMYRSNVYQSISVKNGNRAKKEIKLWRRWCLKHTGFKLSASNDICSIICETIDTWTMYVSNFFYMSHLKLFFYAETMKEISPKHYGIRWSINTMNPTRWDEECTTLGNLKSLAIINQVTKKHIS